MPISLLKPYLSTPTKYKTVSWQDPPKKQIQLISNGPIRNIVEAPPVQNVRKNHPPAQHAQNRRKVRGKDFFPFYSGKLLLLLFF